MGKEFGVKPDQLRAAAKDFDEVSRVLKACTADMRSVRNRLEGNSLGYYRGVISSLAEAGDAYAKHTGSLGASLEDIAAKYGETEQRILNGMDTWQNRILEWGWSQGKENLGEFVWDKAGDVGPVGKAVAGIASEMDWAFKAGIGTTISGGLLGIAEDHADVLAQWWVGSNADDYMSYIAKVGDTAKKGSKIFGIAGKVVGAIGNGITVVSTAVGKHNKYKDADVEGLVDFGVITDSRFVAETVTESAVAIAAGAAAGSVGGPAGIAIGVAVSAADIGCKWATKELFGEEYEAGLYELVAGKYIAQSAVLGIVEGKIISFVGDALASTDNAILSEIGNFVSSQGDKFANWNSSLLQGTTAGNEVKFAGAAIEFLGDSMASSDIGFLSEIGNVVSNTGDAVVGWTVEA